MISIISGIGIGLGLLLAAVVFVSMSFRRVVSTNEAHIVQTRKKTISYGKDTQNGNIYYEWPSWIPFLGLTKIALPVSVFDLTFQGYEAYDKDRVPFVVDIVAFFRIEDTNIAAQRVENFSELLSQLKSIVQGAIRTVLASHDLDSIMLERSKFGEQFTKEVEGQLKNWGVATVKNIELMDIRDSNESKVVHNIMEKKKSLIEMQSRSEVAENRKKAAIAEIDAARDTKVQEQVAIEAVGLRTAENQRKVGVANQQASQSIKEQESITKDKEMSILKIAQVRQAEIDKEVNVVRANQEKEMAVLIAEGKLESKTRESKGIVLEGEAKANAEKAMQLAPVQAQIVLAQEIGQNESYQKYLITIRQVEKDQIVGVEQAKALERADVKIIANTGEPTAGLKNVMDLFSSKGGTQLGAMVEAFKQMPEGSKLLNGAKKVVEEKANSL